MSKLVKFTVKRSTWARGCGSLDSFLLNYNGKMCCLGFLARELGFSEESIEGRPHPRVCGLGPELPGEEPHRFMNESWDPIIKVNDRYDLAVDQDLSEKEREEALAIMFREKGYAVEFVD